MKLKELLEKFTLEDSDERECIGNNPFTALQEPPLQFKEVAKTILSGHFLVENASDNDDVRKVYPTCVEIYYHEEQEGGVKDPIVYHRNRKKTENFEIKPPLFPLGVLHNHVSGIDITFEQEANANNKKITGIVRASALIREFKVKDKDGKWVEFTKIKNDKEEKYDIEDRSTYIYDYLFGQFSIFDGFTIRWEDDEECDLEEPSLRKNVFEYQSKEFDYEKNPTM